MKVLHIWNVANIAGILCKYLYKLDIDCDVIHRCSYNINSPLQKYNVTIPMYCSSNEYKKAILSLVPNYDIIHIHADDSNIKSIKDKYPDKPIIITYHGTNIRNKWIKKKDIYCLADKITVSTKDLLDGAIYPVEYIENPIDRELWTRKNDYIPDTALFVEQSHIFTKSKNVAYNIADMINVFLIIQERYRVVIPYTKYPRFMENFEYYLDIKENYKRKGELINALSTAGLQALSLGCKVINSFGAYNKFPEEHNAERVAKKWIKIYEELI